MPSLNSLVFGLRIAGTAIGAAAILRLYFTGLHKQFRVLFWFLCFNELRVLVDFLIPPLFDRPRNAYAWAWVVSEPILWVFYILLVLDLYSLVLQNYKGLQTVGRWILFIAMPVAI